MPLAITMTVVRAGMPPISSARPMAMGVVTDLGAMVRPIRRGAPISQTMPTALTMAKTPPAKRPMTNPLIVWPR